MFRNLVLIQKVIVRYVMALVAVFSVVSMLFQKPGWAMSSILGAMFSFYVFHKLLQSQSHILKTKNKNHVFLSYLVRLGIVAIPLVIGSIFKAYINLIILIIFLFSFQFLYIIFELKKNYRRYLRRKRQWIN